MHVVPLLIAFFVALLGAPVLLRGLQEAGFVRTNDAGREVPVPSGILIPLAAFVALGISAPLDRLLNDDILGGAGAVGVMIYIIGVCLLGAIDDLLGTPVIEGGLGRHDPRGVRATPRRLSAAASRPARSRRSVRSGWLRLRWD